MTVRVLIALIICGLGTLACGKRVGPSLELLSYEAGMVLEIEAPVRAELQAGGTQSFSLPLVDEELAIIRFERGNAGQVGEVNLRMDILSPDNRLVEAVDTGSGPSLIIFQAKETGQYRLNVKGWDDDVSGPYTVLFEKSIPPSASNLEKIDQLLSHFYRDNRPGGGIAIRDKRETVYQRTFGLADIEETLKFDESVPSELASLSKQFTAYAIAMLIAEGQLNRQDTVRSILPEFPEIGDAITIHHLVHHLSGLKNYEADLSVETQPDGIINREDIWGWILENDSLEFPAGTNYQYSNTGYVVLAKIIERVTGKSFEDWMRENIFVPLEMSDSFIWRDSAENAQSLASSYLKDPIYSDHIDVLPSLYAKQDKDLESIGGAHVHSSLRDMIKWADNYYSGQVGGETVLNIIQEGIIAQSQPWDYLYGLNQYRHNERLRQGHEGLTQGYRTLYARFPTEQVDFIFLTNDGEWRTYYIAETIIDLYFGN